MRGKTMFVVLCGILSLVLAALVTFVQSISGMGAGAALNVVLVVTIVGGGLLSWRADRAQQAEDARREAAAEQHEIQSEVEFLHVLHEVERRRRIIYQRTNIPLEIRRDFRRAFERGDFEAAAMTVVLHRRSGRTPRPSMLLPGFSRYHPLTQWERIKIRLFAAVPVLLFLILPWYLAILPSAVLSFVFYRVAESCMRRQVRPGLIYSRALEW